MDQIWFRRFENFFKLEEGPGIVLVCHFQAVDFEAGSDPLFAPLIELFVIGTSKLNGVFGFWKMFGELEHVAFSSAMNGGIGIEKDFLHYRLNRR